MNVLGTCGDRDHHGRRLIDAAAALVADLRAGIAAAPTILLLSAVAMLLQLSPELQSLLELRFADLICGSLWRLASSHLLHWSWNHCLWDAVVFLAAGGMCESRWPGACRRVLFWSAGLIPLVVMVVAPELQCYRGLSGVDSALFALAAAMLLQEEWRSGRRMMASVAGLAVLCQFLKIAAEIQAGQTLFVSDRTFVPVPMAHLTGALVGSLVAACYAVVIHKASATGFPASEYGVSPLAAEADHSRSETAWTAGMRATMTAPAPSTRMALRCSTDRTATGARHVRHDAARRWTVKID